MDTVARVKIYPNASQGDALCRHHGAILAIVTAVNLKLGCGKVCGVKCQSCTEDAQRGGEKDLMFIALRLDIDLK